MSYHRGWRAVERGVGGVQLVAARLIIVQMRLSKRSFWIPPIVFPASLMAVAHSRTEQFLTSVLSDCRAWHYWSWKWGERCPILWRQRCKLAVDSEKQHWWINKLNPITETRRNLAHLIHLLSKTYANLERMSFCKIKPNDDCCDRMGFWISEWIRLTVGSNRV